MRCKSQGLTYTPQRSWRLARRLVGAAHAKRALFCLHGFWRQCETRRPARYVALGSCNACPSTGQPATRGGLCNTAKTFLPASVEGSVSLPRPRASSGDTQRGDQSRRRARDLELAFLAPVYCHTAPSVAFPPAKVTPSHHPAKTRASSTPPISQTRSWVFCSARCRLPGNSGF